jgi:hypothetical protein
MLAIVAAANGGQGLEHAEPDDTGALRFCLRASGSTSCPRPEQAGTFPFPLVSTTERGLSPMPRRCRQPSPRGSGRGVAMGCSGWIAPLARGSSRARCRVTSTRRSNGIDSCRRSYAAANRRMTAGDDAP